MVEKAEFRNRTEGFVGAVVMNPETSRHEGISVGPGDSVWLSEQEQVATANAPRLPSDNPFINGSAADGGKVFELVTEARPYGGAMNNREIGKAEPVAEPEPAPAPPVAPATEQPPATTPPPPAPPAGPTAEEEAAAAAAAEEQAKLDAEKAAAAEAEEKAKADAAKSTVPEATKAKAPSGRRRRAARQAEETGAAPQPAGDAPEGSFETGEETGTDPAAGGEDA